MAKNARIRRERAEREALKEAGVEKVRGPISPRDAVIRARLRKHAGTGVVAFGSRLRKEIKQYANFNRPKK